jgi:Zn finger protein HypA/HybF involved in hydrogenase expression
MEASETRLDGNAIGGVMLELFGVEMTTATGVCGSCGAAAQVATLHVYVRAPGTVLRCPHCEAVLMRIVRGRDRTWLDFSGLGSIELPAAGA